jgi:hypothetical protein
MITTSNPTGPSIFRLIHQTNCTVGMDEAERYHNPKDPGMQQVRQLLNSGYKQGMPAIRVTGDDLKPQAATLRVAHPLMLRAIAAHAAVGVVLVAKGGRRVPGEARRQRLVAWPN